MNLPKNLQKKINDRIDNDLYRELPMDSHGIDFYSNDYLGFSKNKNIFKKVNDALLFFENINGSTGSRLISGNSVIHEEIESELAAFFKTSAALIFNSGYDANVGLFSAVLQHGDMVYYDELCHASIRDGIKLSNAKSFGFRHNNLKNFIKKYENTHSVGRNKFLIVESIYSMDGDQAPLKEMADFCDKNNIYMVVDEAHATGVFGDLGRGLVNALNLEKKIFARVHTFGKALGCHGAVVVGSESLRGYLINYARSFIYTTAISLQHVLTIKFVLKELKWTNERKKLLNNIEIFKSEIKKLGMEDLFIHSNSAIHSCIIPDNTRVSQIAKKISAHNFKIKAIRSPTIPKGTERIRFCIHSYNSKEQIEEIFNLLSTFVLNSDTKK